MIMSGKTALITGAQAGIGAACAIRLAQEGIAIGVLDLDAGRCAETVETITAAGGKALALGADVSDRSQVQAALATLRKAFGPVTIVVNNAGVVDFAPFEEIPDETWNLMFRVNTFGTFVVTQEVLPDMKAAGWGRIVNISSSSAQTGTPTQVHYAASKGAVISMTRSLAQELGPLGITVNNIPPGMVMGTIMSEANTSRWPVEKSIMAGRLPVGRLGEPEDIANACAWLCSEATGYVTGQTIGVNGGRVVS
jgi:2-hydroxycyclohexanecarboxyl-CoA dehydrogenase